MSVLTDAVESIQTKEAELLKLLTDSVTPVLDVIAKMGTVGVIYVYGYTPGFNDGEPCEHTTNHLLGLQEVGDEERMEYFLSVVGKAAEDSDALSELESLEYKSKWKGDPQEEIDQYYADKARLYNAFASELGVPTTTVTGDDARAVNKAVSTVIIPALDREFGTNYQVAYLFKDGQVVRVDDEYDCGY